MSSIAVQAGAPRRMIAPLRLVPEATHGLAPQDGPTAGDLCVDRLTSHGWRVTDLRMPAHDPFRLLGFIEYLDGQFEVMQVGTGIEWHAFDTLEDCLAHIMATATTMARRRLVAAPIDVCRHETPRSARGSMHLVQNDGA